MAQQLTQRQRLFIAELQKGVSGAQAAIAAGYSPRTAKHAAHQLMHDNKLVMAELEKVKQHLAVATEYNGERCMADCDKAMVFATKTENANAFVRAVELKARLSGHLREKVDVTIEHRVDLGEALAAAKARAAVRPICDPAEPIDGEFKALPSSASARPIDCESIGPFGNDH